MKQKIMRFAGYGATSLFGIKSNNKVYSNVVSLYYAGVLLFNKSKLDRDMSVGFSFFNPRATAILNKNVVAGVMKKEYGKVLRRFCTSKKVKYDLAFSTK
jgi:hypothetical protein